MRAATRASMSGSDSDCLEMRESQNDAARLPSVKCATWRFTPMRSWSPGQPEPAQQH